MKRIFIMLLLLILFLIPSVLQVSAQESTQPKFAVYFGGIGCPHCARVTPVLLKRVQEGEMIVMEYEIYKNLANSQALSGYADSYGLSLGVPQIMFYR